MRSVSLLGTLSGLVLAGWLQAAEVIPPAPERYFNDYARVVASSTAERIDRQLEDFEKATSSQIVVAVYPKMQSDSAIEDYTVRVARAWKVGQRMKNNGAVLFVFIQDRKMWIQVGYGLEGALPDAIAKRIVEEQIKPRFQRGDYDGGLTAGVNAMVQAAKGEYQGTGRTAASQKGSPGFLAVIRVLWPFLLLCLFIFILRRATRGTVYHRYGRRPSPWFWGGAGGGAWSGSGGSWRSGGGGFSSGGFSGGGGSFGGGGAGGSW